jgi:hypothetical protein
MGARHFQRNDKFNPRGYYEDLRWRTINQKLTGRGYSLKAAGLNSVPKGMRWQYKALAEQCSMNLLWGVKDPWFCFVVGRAAWNQIQAVGTEVRMVIVRRNLEASRASIAKHLKKSYGGRYGKAGHVARTWRQEMDKRLGEWKGETHTVQYEHLVADPRPHIEALWAFCSEGMDIETGADLDKIAQWVTPQLKHF